MSSLSSLAQAQAAFMAQVLDEDAPMPAGWSRRHAAGMAVYRGNFRAALVEALRDTYDKTARWVGEEAFRAAAAHHVILHPPHSWTIDAAGAGFSETCAELFANDPEVAELAWLEWAMLHAFTAADTQPLDADGFAAATADFSEDQWAMLRLEFVPGVATREVAHDLAMIWHALGQDTLQHPEARLAASQAVLVWREGERATFALREAEECHALLAMQSGMGFGELCMILAGDDPTDALADEAALRVGAMLGRWLADGLIEGLGVMR
ncbi:MAG: putative DNA-binding domain-containing protein [Erythrobacter sp.]